MFRVRGVVLVSRRWCCACEGGAGLAPMAAEDAHGVPRGKTFRTGTGCGPASGFQASSGIPDVRGVFFAGREEKKRPCRGKNQARTAIVRMRAFAVSSPWSDWKCAAAAAGGVAVSAFGQGGGRQVGRSFRWLGVGSRGKKCFLGGVRMYAHSQVS